MPFWRSWGAALLGASGVAVAVPVGLLLVVAVAAGLSGGFAFRGLGQVTAGPALPGSAGVAAAATPALPTVPRARRRAARVASSGTSGPGSAAGTQDAAPGRRPSGAGSGSGSGGGTRPPSGGGTQGVPPGATTPPSATPPSSTTPTPPAAVVGGVQSTVEPIPVVGPAAADAVGSIAGLILPPGTLLPRAP